MWVRSSFGDEASMCGASARWRPSRPACTAHAASRASDAALWSQLYTPLGTEQLAVNAAKVEEVLLWLSTAQRRLATGTRQTPFLLLTGPAGAGKSSCLRCVAARLDMQLLEWLTPAAAKYRPDADFRAHEPWEGPGDTVTPEGQLRQFGDFLMRANRYGTVLTPSGDGGRLVLVDDLPNALLFRREQFYDILRRYGRGARSPCVFVINDGGTRSDLSSLSVFPDSVQHELGVHQITFRPVSNKQLVVAMERVLATATVATSGVKHPGRGALEELAAASSGDVRAAVNALQFICGGRTGVGVSKRARGAGRRGAEKRPKLEEPTAVGSRDSSLGLFRALGKIIYAKRSCGEEPPLPARLCALGRSPLLEQQPEVVMSRAGVQPATVVTHLHHNYTDFCQRLEDAVTAVDYISHADLLTADWQSRASTLEYGSSVAARGVMFSRPTSVSLGFRQFSQPRITSIDERRQRRWERLRAALADWRVTGQVLVTDMLPYLNWRAPEHRANISSLPEHEVAFYRSIHQPLLESGECSDEDDTRDLGIEEYDD